MYYEEDELLEEQPAQMGEKCPRCLVPVPLKATRCPNCRMPVAHSRNIFPILAGVGCLLALVFLFVMMYRTMTLTELKDATPIQDSTADSGKFAPPPETSAGHEPPAPSPGDQRTDSEQQKKAPLNR